MSNIYMRALINRIPEHLRDIWCLIAENDECILLYNDKRKRIYFDVKSANYSINIGQSISCPLLFKFELVDLNGTEVCYLEMNDHTFVLYPAAF